MKSYTMSRRSLLFNHSMDGRQSGKTLLCRIEIFSPPYALDTANKPTIASVAGKTDGIAVSYGQEFNVVIRGVQPSVLRLALAAPTTITHSFNANQRVIILELVSWTAATSTARVRAPPNANVAPPQLYMLFAMNLKTYGRAVWVRVG
jgi:hypothetical protein